MKNIRTSITELNVARSSDCSKEKSEEIKRIIQDFLPYAELEEELGIDLLTLFKALKDGVYYKYTFNDKHSGFITLIEFSDFTDICYDQDFKEWCIDIQGMSHFTTKNYGKTWALTKEELETK